ncbi:MAG: sugar ABC transporter permease [Bacilli bacterium]|nr:sugar ABC transporter permease [Bacilli bacterium]
MILLIPLLLFTFFVWYPIGFNLVLSFFNNEKFESFVGFQNYAAIFQDQDFLDALRNTFLYIFWSLIIGFLVPIIMGFLLSEAFHAKGFFRICIYLPCMISGMAVVFLFKSMFGNNSWDVINVILIRWFGANDAVEWTSDYRLAIPVIILAMTWRGAGGTALIYLSNFQQIDDAIYEAARIDGATPLQRFNKLTLPMMKTTIFMLLILQVISVFQVFYEPMVIAGVDNNNGISLMLLAYSFAYVKNDSLGRFQYAKSAATSVVLALIILTFTILYFGLTKFFEKRAERSRA